MSDGMIPAFPRVELISTGAELLTGRTINRHAAALGLALSAYQIPLLRDTTLPDDQTAIAQTLREALVRSDIIVVSGGLGPTSDDITRDAVAEVLGVNIVHDEGAVAHISSRMERMGRAVTSEILRQALVLSGARVLPNPVGLAPGMIAQQDARYVVLLPGPPREFDAILRAHFLPWFERLLPAKGEVIEDALFMLTGIGESDVQRFVTKIGLPSGVHVAYCAAPGRVELKLSPGPLGSAEFREAVAALEPDLCRFIYSRKRETLGEVLGRMMVERRLHLAVAESCTGGGLGAEFTSVPGASSWFLGGVIAYDNRIKRELLGVPDSTLAEHGAVSEATALAMAHGVRERLGASLGLSVTGIAGPSGGTPDKPVGTVWIGLSAPSGSVGQLLALGGSRDDIRDVAIQRALGLMWEWVSRTEGAVASPHTPLPRY